VRSKADGSQLNLSHALKTGENEGHDAKTTDRPIYQEETVIQPSVYGNYTEICSYVAKETLLSTRVLQ